MRSFTLELANQFSPRVDLFVMGYIEDTGVFSNTEIQAAYQSGHIVIHPFNEKHVNTSSYDVTLGEYYWRTDKSKHDLFLNPFDKNNVDGYFGHEPKKALTHRQWLKAHPNYRPFKGIPLDHQIITLAAGERILGHSHEFIGINPPGTTAMHARSTWGRLGIQVCEDAGWGDSGYINRWTLEIHNGNEHRMVVLPVGERIAQLIFFHTGKVEGEYSTDSGKYQTAKELDEIIRGWDPLSMLPRAYKDQRQPPAKI